MIATLITTTLVAQGIPLGDAETVSLHVIQNLRRMYGGTCLYVTSPQKNRNVQILQEWRKSNGTSRSIREIAKKNGVAVGTVYRIIKRYNQKQRPKPAAPGFGDDEWVL